MKTIIKLFFIPVLINIIFAGCSNKDSSSSDSTDDEFTSASNVADNNATFVELTLSEVTAVTSPNVDNTPNYTFSSTKAGTITYGGSCTSSTTIAVAGNNTITLNTLSDGTYSDCTITVTPDSD